ncbi:MAG: chemotaxis protein CheW [bacterium]
MQKNDQTQGVVQSTTALTAGSATDRWGEIRHRLEASRLALETRFEPSTEEKRKILKARAAALARKTGKERGIEAQLRIVEFLLAKERYGIEPRFVRDVFPLKTLTPIPCTPPFVLGITNLRGEILSVLDLKKFFDLPEEGLTNLTKVIVLESSSMTFGVLADSVIGVRAILETEVQPALPTFTDIREKYLKGVTEDRIAILDASEILLDERIRVYEEV